MSVSAHQRQYRHNRKVLSNLLVFDQPPYDWVVTVAFYAALHLVEEEISCCGESSSSHINRRHWIRRLPQLKTIAATYFDLEMESKRSRYFCIPFDQDNAQVAINKLLKIEQHLLTTATNPTPSQPSTP